ncbi:MAG: hypothetical protein IJ728_09305 [Selenomonadaceae bacterium]|nr:hypothetical protein [Selenomonadaceae bacterium]
MLPEEKKNIEETINAEEFFKSVPDENYNFKLRKIFQDTGDDYEILTYTNETTHRGLKIYFHFETSEYRLSKIFGLNEFCLTEFFSEDINKFVDILKNNFDSTLKSLNEFNGDKNFFVDQKKIPSWQYGINLSTELEGFQLFLSPNNFLEITNGSFVVINYCDFNINSDLAIYYNIFTDDFGGEVRINGSAQVIYDFDTDDLKTLELKLKNNLVDRLKMIRKEFENLQ